MTRRVFLGAAVCSASAATRAEQGKETLDRVINALGGSNFLGMQNRVETGRAVSLYREQISGLSQSKVYTEYVRDSVRERQFFGEKKDSSTLMKDGKGWDINFKGAHVLDAETMERYQLASRHNFFYILRLRLKEPGMTFEVSGHEVVENQSADVLDVYDAENENVTVWVNAFTHLPIRQRWYRREKGTGYRYEEMTHFSKYREFSGIKWPMDVQRDRDGAKMSQIYSEEVKFNQTLKGDIFELPAGIKVL